MWQLLLYLAACLVVGLVTGLRDINPNEWEFWALMGSCVASYFAGFMKG